ncbi:NUDIX domain-containing protein [Candidatus Parcubacteria bacterium]|nr:NUDIX domain-containing protein [Candidatus Parcubacteria bacterium]
MKYLKYCIKCGSANIKIKGNNMITCSDCNFVYYHGIRITVTCVLKYQGKFVFSFRNIEPQKGYLDLIGGFVDPGESAEEALIRECKEEIGISIEKKDIKYITSFPCLYSLYNVCDIFFEVVLKEFNPVLDKKEISEILLLDKKDINIEKIAFESQKKFFMSYF